MELNVKKGTIMQFTSSKKKNPFHYTMKGEPVEIVHHHPYLGVELNDSLKYHLHIDNICKKVSSVLSFLKRNLKHSPPKVKERAYQSLIRPKVEYATPIWNPQQKTQIKQIQRNTARFAKTQIKKVEQNGIQPDLLRPRSNRKSRTEYSQIC